MTDILDRMRAADPAPDSVHGRHVDIDGELDDIIARAETPRVRSHRRPGRRILAGAAACAVLAGGFAVSPFGLDISARGGHGIVVPAGHSASAAELLQRAANIVPQDPATRPGQYWEVTSTAMQHSPSLDGDHPSTITERRVRRVDYVPVDGRGATFFRQDDATLIGGRWKSAPPLVYTVPPATDEPSWLTPSVEFVADLPRETKALRARLYADSKGHGNSRDGAALFHVAGLLRSNIVPADLRAALFRVLATVPGVEVTSSQATVDGRTGVGFGRLETENGMREEIVIDPDTGTVGGERTIVPEAVDDGNGVTLPAGLVYWEESVTRRVVDAVPATIRDNAEVARNEG